MNDKIENKQIKSKRRVADHGEVFTAEREVNAMLDLVKDETERIDSRFLEPACGTGNFLTKILERKLNVVRQRFSKSLLDYEPNALVGVSCMYGIDILMDNVEECRTRLFQQFKAELDRLFPDNKETIYLDNIRYILQKNILWGDALTLRTPDDSARPIIFSEWTMVDERGNVKRKEYTMANLMESQPYEGNNLFSDLGEEAFLPTPIKEYPLTHYLKLKDYERL
jgi:hypothetical protein